MNNNIPQKIKRHLNTCQLQEILTGRLGDQIWKYQDKEQNYLYLKFGSGVAAKSLQQETDALVCLENKGIKIPRVLEFYHQNSQAFLLISQVDGVASHKVKDRSRHEVLKIVAEALRLLNMIKVKDSSKLNSLEKDLDEIKQYISMEVIDKEKFLQNNNKSPEEVYDYLIRSKNKYDEKSFTHGDYCLPNVLINGDDFGMIDFGDCGMGDKYKDFSSMEVSIKRNFGEEWIADFYKYYESNIKVDKNKIKYYQFIDQFDYCLDIEKYNSLVNKK